MRAYDIIEKKKNGLELTKDEIQFFIKNFLNGTIKDYQMTAFLMAICLKGMNNQECEFLTKEMLDSGDKVDLSGIHGIKVDKHSTGGVGDKTTLIIAPIVACFGVKVAKMSGRGLGYTGGTIDKLESIEGFKVELNKNDFFKIVNEVGCCVISQSGNLVPADKKIYALRDVTATVESIPLISSSIMSKKLASGADCILLDVKVGDGAFMKTINDAIELSKLMVNIGHKFNRKVSAVITSMEQPLGNAIGNFIEVWEACEVLKGKGPEDLKEVSICLAAQMLYMGGKGTLDECREMAEESIRNGTAFNKFKEMIIAQNGDPKILDELQYPNKAAVTYECTSDMDGYITSMKASLLGKSAMTLGAGRQNKDDYIDPYAGILLHKKVGNKIQKGDVLATLFSSSIEKCKEAEQILNSAIQISKSPTHTPPLILAKITNTETKIYNS